MKKQFDKLPKVLFYISLAVTIYVYGILSYLYYFPPYPLFRDAVRSVQVLRDAFELDEQLYTDYKSETISTVTHTNSNLTVTHYPDRLSEGLMLVTGVAKDRQNVIRIIDREGTVIHRIRPDWFEIWGSKEGNFPEDRRPQSPPGALIHGLDLFEDGDIVANFDSLSTMRMNLCGEVIWKLDNLGHHAIHIAEDETIWAPAETYIEKPPTGYRNHKAPLRSWTLQHISKEGDILETIPVIDILLENDLKGLLSLSTLDDHLTEVSGDTLHLNDLEIFPSEFTSSIFKAGDIMFSLRNINSIIVMDAETRKIKYRTTGEVLRHHDPDFMNGDVISIFDNNNLMPSGGLEKQFSRIVEINARTGEKRVVVDGAKNSRFFSDITGMHQRLPNGNILIVSGVQGRVLETLPDGTLAWEYTNKLDDNKIGRMVMAMLLPPHMDKKFFETQQEKCS